MLNIEIKNNNAWDQDNFTKNKLKKKKTQFSNNLILKDKIEKKLKKTKIKLLDGEIEIKNIQLKNNKKVNWVNLDQLVKFITWVMRSR